MKKGSHNMKLFEVECVPIYHEHWWAKDHLDDVCNDTQTYRRSLKGRCKRIG